MTNGPPIPPSLARIVVVRCTRASSKICEGFPEMQPCGSVLFSAELGGISLALSL